MKKIGLLSDTHSILDERIFGHFAECDEVWHAGDFGSFEVLETLRAFKPLRGVYGNIDDVRIQSQMPLDLRFVCEDVPVFMTHIGGYPGRYQPRVRKILQADPPRNGLFICGHSHILKVMPDKQMGFLHLNPGACGNEGWHQVRTLMRFELAAGSIRELQVIELGPRSRKLE
ncbi:MAG: metallophosphoesterase family protein [Saprospirales bacterium]|jgi:putative phosphoesterase|nr:metallophosphoesterase family protein [Saprospirales bacterium]MBK8921359.1 metallophosphoesterase family protein [Saprospirales bacterium]